MKAGWQLVWHTLQQVEVLHVLHWMHWAEAQATKQSRAAAKTRERAMVTPVWAGSRAKTAELIRVKM